MATIQHYTDKAMLLIPSAASGVSVTPSGTAYVNSSWVELTTGIAFDIVGVGLIVNPGVGDVQFRADLGKGAAGSEVIAGTVGGYVTSIAGDSSFARLWLSIKVVANTRLAVRMRKSGANTVVWTFKLAYYELVAAGVNTAQFMVAVSQLINNSRMIGRRWH